MVDVTKRMNYFDRQFLRAADFQDEQAYDLDRRRRHNRLLHAPGVAEGLPVSGNVDDAFVTVSPGTAYDALGEEIVLAVSEQVSVAAITGATAYITIAYAEQASDPSTDPGVTGNSTRISEQPGLAASAMPPANPNLTIPLARVALVGGKVSGAPDNTVRNPAAAVVAPDLTLRSVTLRNDAVAPSTWPRLVCSGANTAALQNGGLSLGVGGVLRLEGGTGATDTATYFSFGGNGTFGIDAPGVPNGRFVVGNSGNVGIGTAAPRSVLEADVSAPSALGPRLTLTNTGGGTNAAAAVDFNTFPPSSSGTYNPSARIEAVDDGNFANDIVFSSNNPGAANHGLVESARITSNGNLGIGTAAPDRPLAVQSQGVSQELISFKDPTGATKWHINQDLGGANPGLNFAETGVADARLFVKAGGNVGIGTAAPDRHVTVQGNTGGTYLNVKDSATANGGPWEILMGVDLNGGIVSTMTNHDLQLRSGANNTHMIIKTDGKIGIGTTTPGFILDAVTRIRLRQGADFSAGLWLFQTTPNADRAFVGMATDTQVGLWGNTGANWGLVMDTGTGNVGIGISVNAPAAKLDVGGPAHASTYTASSDERFKTNIAPLTDALQKIDSIRGVVFDWNELYESLGRSTGRREIGVIAQEVEKVFPELVSTWHEEGYKALDYGRLTAVLVEAVKELKAKNEALERRVEALESRLGEAPRERPAGSPAQRGSSRRNGNPE